MMIVSKLLSAAIVLASTPSSVSEFTWKRRVLLISASNERDPSLLYQRRALAGWKSGAEERDLTVVEIVGDRVVGSTDPADTLRQRYALSAASFVVVLIGKDGGVKLRRVTPIPVAALKATIDTMPMRRREAQ